MYNPKKSGNTPAREDIANYNPAIHGAQWELQKNVILSHEVAHMWFGNLATPQWWDNIILKESSPETTRRYVSSTI